MPTPPVNGVDGAPLRLFFLDWLRVAALAVLVCYHVGMYYVTWDWHIKSPFAGPVLEPFMLLSAPWRMSLLFLVSGAATAAMFQKASSTNRHSTGPSTLKSRSKRLLLPLLFGVVFIVPPQAYFEVVQRFAFSGSFGQFLGLYFSGYRGFCKAGQCLLLPTWNHLWFLPYLWVYTVLLWSLVRVYPDLLGVLRRVSCQVLAGAGLALMPLGVITGFRLSLFARFPSTHALVDDWFNHAMYFSVFLWGAVLTDARLIWEQLMRARWISIAAALAGWTLTVTQQDGLLGPWGKELVIATFQWGALASVLGFGYLHLNRDHPWRGRLTEAVFPVYILHQTFIILLAQVLLPLRWTPIQEGPLLIGATFLLSWGGYALVRRARLLRPWFGLR